MEVARTAMVAEANEMWTLGVGFWNGADLALGKVLAGESEGELPMAPGAVVKFKLRFVAKERLPCAAEAQPRCVELSLRSIPDPKALKPALEKFVTSLVPPGQTPPQGGAARAEQDLEGPARTDRRVRTWTEVPQTCRRQAAPAAGSRRRAVTVPR